MAFNVTQSPFQQSTQDLGRIMEANRSEVNQTLNSTSELLDTPVASRIGAVCLEYDIPNAFFLLLYTILGLGNWLTVLSFAKTQ